MRKRVLRERQRRARERTNVGRYRSPKRGGNRDKREKKGKGGVLKIKNQTNNDRQQRLLQRGVETLQWLRDPVRRKAMARSTEYIT